MLTPSERERLEEADIETIRERLVAQRNGLKFIRGNRACKKVDNALAVLDKLKARLLAQDTRIAELEKELAGSDNAIKTLNEIIDELTNKVLSLKERPLGDEVVWRERLLRETFEPPKTELMATGNEPSSWLAGWSSGYLQLREKLLKEGK